MMDGIQAAPSYTWEDKGTLLQQTMPSPNIKEIDRALSKSGYAHPKRNSKTILVPRAKNQKKINHEAKLHA
jgi:hypothetical protein